MSNSFDKLEGNLEQASILISTLSFHSDIVLSPTKTSQPKSLQEGINNTWTNFSYDKPDLIIEDNNLVVNGSPIKREVATANDFIMTPNSSKRNTVSSLIELPLSPRQANLLDGKALERYVSSKLSPLTNENSNEQFDATIENVYLGDVDDKSRQSNVVLETKESEKSVENYSLESIPQRSSDALKEKTMEELSLRKQVNDYNAKTFERTADAGSIVTPKAVNDIRKDCPYYSGGAEKSNYSSFCNPKQCKKLNNEKFNGNQISESLTEKKSEEQLKNQSTEIANKANNFYKNAVPFSQQNSSCCKSENVTKMTFDNALHTKNAHLLERKASPQWIPKEGVTERPSCCKSSISKLSEYLPVKNILSSVAQRPLTSLKELSSCTSCDENMTARNTCDLNTCEKLNISDLKRTRNCCTEKLCPINDPTSSTYNFLLNVRMCCKTRGCQLAAKICDIYEPLVEINPNLDDVDIGEPQYHYLSGDISTNTDQEVDAASDSSDSSVTLENPDIKPAELEEDNARKSSSYVKPAEGNSDRRRTSTVNWSVPADFPKTSSSQQQVISQATAEADKFRNTPESTKYGSVFEVIVRKGAEEKEPVELSKEAFESEIYFKSQIDTINIKDSRHKPKCFPCLRAKFKKKKNETDEQNGFATDWRLSRDSEKRRTTLNVTPVQEKNEQINTLLDKM